MDEYAEIAEVSGHEYISFPLFFSDDLIYFFSDFWFFEVSKGGDSLLEGREVGASETGGVGLVCFSFVLVHFVWDAPVDKPLNIFSRLEL